MPLWGLASKEMQQLTAAAYEQIITFEDHLLDGGFGSWLMEALAPLSRQVSVRPHALSPKVWGTVRAQAVLNKLGGIVDITWSKSME